MDPEDFVSPEVAVAVAATAALASSRVRRMLRRGAVYALAGALMAGDAARSFGKGVGRGVQQATSTMSQGGEQATAPAQGEEA